MRQRIVINVDAPGGGAPSRRPTAGARRRWPRVLLVLFLLFVVIAVAALAGGYFWWRHYQSTPTYSLTLLVDAAQRNDLDQLQKLIDEEEIAKSMAASVSQKAAGRYGLALNASIKERIDAIVPLLLPQMKQTLEGEVVREIKAFAAGSEPRSFVFLLVTVPSLVKVTTEGDVAKATAAIGDRSIALTLKRDAERWKVVDFEDEVVVQRMVDSVMKELPAIGNVDPNSPLLKKPARGKRSGRRR